MSHLWNSVNTQLPPMAKRVITKDYLGHVQMAKRVFHDDRVVWVDDNSLPVKRMVIGWIDPVSLGEIVE